VARLRFTISNQM